MIYDDELSIKPSEYTYSDPVFVKRWNSGYISVKVGYVKKHPEDNDICLEKKWKGAKGITLAQNFNIKNKKDWNAVKNTVEGLLPDIEKVPSREDIDNAIEKVSKETGLLELIAKYPKLIEQTQNFDILLLPRDQKEALSKFLSVGGELVKNVVDKLSNQPIKDIEEFVKLLEDMKLSTINSLVTHVTSRIGFIEMFEKVIHNDDSFERRGPGSVHNLLKANIWIVDRNFSILHDDETLKTIIEKQWDEIITDKSDKSRPDFLCMTNPFELEKSRNLVIVEIKRPSVELKFSYIEQVMKYREVLDKYSGKTTTNFTCYLVGREVDSLIKSNDLTASGIHIKTYTDFIQEARKFYQEYLNIIQNENYAF